MDPLSATGPLTRGPAPDAPPRVAPVPEAPGAAPAPPPGGFDAASADEALFTSGDPYDEPSDPASASGTRPGQTGPSGPARGLRGA